MMATGKEAFEKLVKNVTKSRNKLKLRIILSI